MCKYWDIICVAKTLRIEAILAMQSATIKSYKRSYTTAICCETVSRYSKNRSLCHYMEKPRDFDPFGQTGLSPFGYNMIDPFGQNSIDHLAHLLL